MQLAHVPQTSMPADVAATRDTYDAVQPARLFAIAKVRLHSAIDALYRDGSPHAPSALSTGFALQQVDTAVGALRGINVPTSSFQHRRRASTAIDHAQRGAELLRTYQDDVQAMGDDPFLRESLPIETLAALDRGMGLLDQALLRID